MYTNDTSTKSKMTMEHERVAVTIIEDDDDDYGGSKMVTPTMSRTNEEDAPAKFASLMTTEGFLTPK